MICPVARKELEIGIDESRRNVLVSCHLDSGLCRLCCVMSCLTDSIPSGVKYSDIFNNAATQITDRPFLTVLLISTELIDDRKHSSSAEDTPLSQRRPGVLEIDLFEAIWGYSVSNQLSHDDSTRVRTV